MEGDIKVVFVQDKTYRFYDKITDKFIVIWNNKYYRCTFVIRNYTYVRIHLLTVT